MSKRILLLLAVMILCMSVFVSCSGDDGKDASVDSVIAQLLADKEKLQAALDEALESGNLEIIEDLKNQIAELQKQLENAGVVSGTTTTDLLAYSDFSVVTQQSDVVITFKIKTIADNKPFEGYTSFNAVYAARNWRDGDANPNNYAYERNRITASTGGVLTQTQPGNYELRFVDAANSASVNIKDLYNMASGVYPFDSNMMVTFTYGDAGLTTAQDPLRQYYLVIFGKVGAGLTRGLVSNEACADCHGADIFNRGLDSALQLIAAQGDPSSSLRRGYHYATADNDVVNSCTTCHAYNGNLAKYVHGIHRSNGATGEGHANYKPVTIKNGYTYAINYPKKARLDGAATGVIENCADCHTGEEAVNARTIVSDDYFKYSLCTQCHIPAPAVDGDSEADKKAKAWDGWTWANPSTKEMHVNFPDATATTCTNCHTGGTARKFSEMHAGWDQTSPISKGFKFNVKSVTVNGNVATVKWEALSPEGVAYDLSVKDADAGDVANYVYKPAFKSDADALHLAFRTMYGQGADVAAGQFDWTNEGINGGKNGTTGATFIGLEDNNRTGVTEFALAPSADETVVTVLINGPIKVKVNGTLETLRVPSASYSFDAATGAPLQRRVIVDDAKCRSCHGAVIHHRDYATFSEVAGSTGGVDTCYTCHNSNFGQNVDEMKYMVHRIHASTENEFEYDHMPVNFTAAKDRTQTGVYYPKAIKDCEACHVNDSHTVVPKPTALALTVNGGALNTTRTDDSVVGPAYATCASCHAGKLDKGLDKHATPFAMGTFTNPATVNKLALTPNDYEACGTCHTRVHVSKK
jgi:OmcA/MtrC family decaheme c-type cytochrome